MDQPTPEADARARAHRIAMWRAEILDPDRDEATTPLAPLLAAFEHAVRADATAADHAHSQDQLRAQAATVLSDIEADMASGRLAGYQAGCGANTRLLPDGTWHGSHQTTGEDGRAFRCHGYCDCKDRGNGFPHSAGEHK